MTKEHTFKINGVDYTSRVEEKADGQLTVYLNGKAFEVEISDQARGAAPKVIHHVVHHVGTAAPELAKPQPDLSSPMPGTVTAINVKPGDKVKKGDVILVIEAMKMANDIVAEGEGTVKEVQCTLGQNVMMGDALISFIPAERPTVVEAPAPKSAPAVAPVEQQTQRSAPGEVVAPLPGVVKQIMVGVGDKVKRGDTVLTIEAMKMENNISAEQSGTVKAVKVSPNQQVNQGETLVVIG